MPLRITERLDNEFVPGGIVPGEGVCPLEGHGLAEESDAPCGFPETALCAWRAAPRRARSALLDRRDAQG